MQSDEQREKQIAMVEKNPVAYLERALKTLKTSNCERFVTCLYDLERMGSGKAEQLLDSDEGTENLLGQIPVGVWLKTLPTEDMLNLKLTLSTFGIDFARKSVADVIDEVEKKLREIRK